MKKLSIILVLIMLVGVFASCNGKRGDEPAEVSGEYQYCTTEIVSGSAKINPIKVNLGYSEYKNGKLIETVEITDSDDILNDSNYNAAEFPMLVLDETMSVYPPVNVLIHNIMVYDMNYNKLKFDFNTLYGLSELPRGEYVIIYGEEADGRGCDPGITDFRINRSVGVFKFVVR